jgi:hypothetical protein
MQNFESFKTCKHQCIVSRCPATAAAAATATLLRDLLLLQGIYPRQVVSRKYACESLITHIVQRCNQLYRCRAAAAMLQGPADARLYRRKYVCESLMTLRGSAAATCLAGKHAASGFCAQQQQEGFSGMLSGSSSSSLDWPIARVVQQAVLLPGLASNLIRSSGLLQWLAAAAAEDVEACSSSSSSSSSSVVLGVATTVAASGSVGTAAAAAAAAVDVPGGFWALGCLLQLLSARVALNKRDQAAEVYDAYSAAAMSVTAAALRAAGVAPATAAGGGFGAYAASSGVRLPLPLLQQLLSMLVLLLEAAPNARLRRQLMQLQLHAVVLGQLRAVVAAACRFAGQHDAGKFQHVCQQLMAHLLIAAGQQH